MERGRKVVVGTIILVRFPDPPYSVVTFKSVGEPDYNHVVVVVVVVGTIILTIKQLLQLFTVE